MSMVGGTLLLSFLGNRVIKIVLKKDLLDQREKKRKKSISISNNSKILEYS